MFIVKTVFQFYYFGYFCCCYCYLFLLLSSKDIKYLIGQKMRRDWRWLTKIQHTPFLSLHPISIDITYLSNISISSCCFLAQDCFQHPSLLAHVSLLVFSIPERKYKSVAHTKVVSNPKEKSER